jgi:hypothetical protein
MKENTYFAPAFRSSIDEILKKNEFVSSQKLFREIFGSVNGISAIIDSNRQIVFANGDFLNLLGLETIEPVLGKRPGEILSCIHSGEELGGCGTSVSCQYCGAVNAILESQTTGKKTTKETRISTIVRGKLKSWDLNVTSSPISLSGETYYAFTIQDISNEKRRSALERTFFHDLLNSAGGLNGLLNILKEGGTPEETPELINLSESASRDILDEIVMHRQIRAAEDGDLQVNIERINSIELLESCVGKISFHEVGQNKKITIDMNAEIIEFLTDRLLLQRVIINLLKNALEATHETGSVNIGVNGNGEKISFWVQNNEVIPEDVQKQLFQRSYSTKGENRGIGTYSIKLLTENYLKGKVSFISNKEAGTIFTVELNYNFPIE